MKFRKLTAAVAASLAVAGTLAVGSTANAQEASTNTFADILEAQGGGTDRNWYDYDILAAAVGVVAASGVDTELIDALSNPSADLTVFLPNDRAFQALAADLFGWRLWFAGEGKVLDTIGKNIDAGTLATVIRYHAVGGAIDSETALGVPRGTALTTLQGGDIRVFPIKRFGTAVLADNDRNDANPFLVRSQLDIAADNGLGHGISFVLRPIDL